MMKRLAPFIIVTLVGLLTALSGTLLYRSKRPSVVAQGTVTPANQSKNLHSLGNPSAKVVLEEYGDFQCPPCGILAEPLNQIVRDFQPDVRLVFRNLPLPVHQHAREAAVAAEAAGLQGKFWEMHDLLYREQAQWSRAPNAQLLFNTYANTVGLDTKRFALDSMSEATHELVEKDEQAAKALNIKNTPTVLLNGSEVEPKNLAPENLLAKVKEAVAATKAGQKK